MAIFPENQHYVGAKRDVGDGTDDGTFQQLGVLSRTAETKKRRQEAEAMAQEATVKGR